MAVIVVNWNGASDTIECLKSLRRLAYSNYTTVLVDNDSWDDSAAQIRKFCATRDGIPYEFVEYTRREALAVGEGPTGDEPPSRERGRRLTLIKNDENLGHPGGVNLAIEYLAAAPTSPDCILILDNDATIEENCLTNLLKVERNLKCGVVGGTVLDLESKSPLWVPSGTLMGQFFPHLVSSESGGRGGESFWASSWLSGASILVRWDVVQKLRSARGSLLHPGLIMHGWELEFAQACRRAGFQPFVAREAVVYHKKRRAFGGMQSPMRYYYENRNMLLLARQILSNPWRAAFYAYSLLLAPLRIAKSLKARSRATARAIGAGLADGFRGIDGKWKDHDREATAGARDV